MTQMKDKTSRGGQTQTSAILYTTTVVTQADSAPSGAQVTLWCYVTGATAGQTVAWQATPPDGVKFSPETSEIFDGSTPDRPKNMATTTVQVPLEFEGTVTFAGILPAKLSEQTNNGKAIEFWAWGDEDELPVITMFSNAEVLPPIGKGGSSQTGDATNMFTMKAKVVDAVDDPVEGAEVFWSDQPHIVGSFFGKEDYTRLPALGSPTDVDL